MLNSNPGMKMVINGHTDNVGEEAYNLKLSKKRAKAVTAYLVLKGIDKQRVYPKGFGETKPVDTNDTKEGRRNNRRVEFEIITE